MVFRLNGEIPHGFLILSLYRGLFFNDLSSLLGELFVEMLFL